jgi:hypothetical protein
MQSCDLPVMEFLQSSLTHQQAISHVPYKSLCKDPATFHAGKPLASNQMSAKVNRNHHKICLLSLTSYFFDTSTVVHFHSASSHLPDGLLPPFLFRSIPKRCRSSIKEWFTNSF